MLTQHSIRKILDYDPLTGIFTWKKPTTNSIKVGDVAGTKTTDGYLTIKILGKKYLAHRLAYLYMEGYFPEHDIDHKFGNKLDNKWSLIGHVSKTCNMQNKKLYSNNTTSFCGVVFAKRTGNWRAFAKQNGKTKHIGMFNTSLEAALARLTWELNTEE